MALLCRVFSSAHPTLGCFYIIFRISAALDIAFGIVLKEIVRAPSHPQGEDGVGRLKSDQPLLYSAVRNRKVVAYLRLTYARPASDNLNDLLIDLVVRLCLGPRIGVIASRCALASPSCRYPHCFEAL